MTDLCDLLKADYRNEEQRKEVQEMLCKIKPFRKYEEEEFQIPQEDLDKFLNVVGKKYEVNVLTQGSVRTTQAEGTLKYAQYCKVFCGSRFLQEEWIYATTAKELMEKLCLLVFYGVRRLKK